MTDSNECQGRLGLEFQTSCEPPRLYWTELKTEDVAVDSRIKLEEKPALPVKTEIDKGRQVQLQLEGLCVSLALKFCHDSVSATLYYSRPKNY
jgi:hypothetical protein